MVSTFLIQTPTNHPGFVCAVEDDELCITLRCNTLADYLGR